MVYMKRTEKYPISLLFNIWQSKYYLTARCIRCVIIRPEFISNAFEIDFF